MPIIKSDKICCLADIDSLLGIKLIEVYWYDLLNINTPIINFIIRASEAKPTLPTNFEENTWAKLKSAIRAIFLKQPDSCDLERLYQVSTVTSLLCYTMFLEC